jgi:hypothetical protein
MNISLDLYIASDDRAVVVEAMNGGFMTSPLGVSQEVAAGGVFSALNSKSHTDSMGFNASLEIITVARFFKPTFYFINVIIKSAFLIIQDIYYLSQCSTLVGTASSQVFRMAVDMSNASGMPN